MKKIFCLSLAAAIAVAGCVKKGEFNFKNIRVEDWQPDWALPILTAKLTLKNVIKTGSVVTEDGSGLYSLHYKGDIFSAKASDYIFIPNQNYTTPSIKLTIPQSSPSFTGNINDSMANNFSFTDTSGAKLSHISFKEGALTVNFNSTFKHDISLQLVFPNITNSGGSPLVVSANIAYPATSATGSANLAGYTVDMTNGGTTKNYLAYKVRFTLTGKNQPISPGDAISANVGITGVKYSFIDGFLGKYSIPMPSDTIAVDVFDNTLNANIYLRNPKVNMDFNSSFGLDLDATFDQIYGVTNKGQQVNMTIAPVSVFGASTPGASRKTTFTLDSTNSSVQYMFNPAPNSVVYNGRMRINPNGTSVYNFITDESSISLVADAELPAWFKIIDFSLQDTVKLILPEDTSLLRRAEFKLLMDNAFPLYGTIQLYFADENYNILDSMHKSENIVGEAPVDASGNVNGRKTAVTTFVMEHDEYNKMAPKVRHALIRGNLKTSGKNDIRILSSNNLVLKMAFRFALNVKSQTL